MLIMMVLMFVIMYFVLIRPQKQRQKELEDRISKLKKGDNVVTTADMHGMVANVKERTVVIKFDNNVKIEFDKAAVASIEAKDTGDSKEETAEEETEETAEPAKTT